MRVLVTGHLGYIGTVMVPMLLKAGHEVVGLDSDLYEHCTFAAGGDIADVPHIRKDVRDADCRRPRRHRRRHSPGRPVQRPARQSQPQTSPTASITAAACVWPGSPRLPRSSAFCLPRRAAITAWPAMSSWRKRARSTPSRPMASPRSGRSAISPSSPAIDFCPTFLRPATAYGLSPRIRFDIVLNNLVAWAVTTGLIYLKSDGSPWRPIVHIEDISRAFIAALEAPKERVFNEAFNVGCTAHNYRIRDIAEIVADVVPDCRLEMAPDAGPDKRSYRVNFAKIARVLAGLQAAMGRAPRRRAALCRLSPVRAHARRVRRAALSAHQPYPATDRRRRARA